MALFFLVGVIPPNSVLAASQFKTPKGFENLTKPIETFVDVYYGGRFVGVHQVTYTPNSLKFSNADVILRSLSDLNNQDVIAELLNKELDNNSDHVCPYKGQSSCGVLEPEVIGIIFDENQFRVDIFVNSAYRQVNSAEYRKYLPPAQGGISIIQNLGAVASGIVSSVTDYNILGLTQLAFQENSLEAGWSLIGSSSFAINSLLFQREFEGYSYQAGYVNTQGVFRFTSDRNILGVRFARSDITQLDQGLIQSTALEVFLPYYGRIEVLKDNQLLYSTLLESGNHLLDTSSFPSGAYNVTIRIFDDKGLLIKEISRFFARQSQLPPAGEPWFSIEVGRIAGLLSDRIIPPVVGPLLARGSLNVRLDDAMAGTIALSMMSEKLLIELGLFTIKGKLEFDSGLMLDSDLSNGARFSVGLRKNHYTLILDYYRIRENLGASLYSTDRKLTDLSREAVNIGFNTQIFGGSASFRLSYRDNEQNGKVNYNTFSYNRTIFHGSQSDIDIRLDFSASGKEKVALLSANWRWDTSNLSMGFAPQYEQHHGNLVEQKQLMAWQANARWQDKEILLGNLSTRFNINHSEFGNTVSLDVDYASQLAKFGLAINRVTDGNRETNTSFALNAFTNFITNGTFLAVGGDQQAQSALIVTIVGVPDTARFDVIVNSQVVGSAIGGRDSIIPLRPYAIYNVQLRGGDSGFYKLSENTRTVTLYPGNVVRMEYEIISLKVVYGLVLDRNREPVANARIVNTGSYSETDETGFFQVEVPSNLQYLELEQNYEEVCRVSLEAHASNKSVLNLGHIICQ
ncbi:CS1-pili formation C-terminal domain-containing protein [Endozoicomonas sp. ONNA2]|uniref:CS1-pili formation C-terminal domain-containing protein n=1 Tax=Endozoicomonas sp. ONNA2 TaxID=2828741 RepID=UPI0021487305|nr:CS1-pili formation C-terminal domain-containing protein [Endozoicomonas sp. ONNA2]